MPELTVAVPVWKNHHEDPVTDLQDDTELRKELCVPNLLPPIFVHWIDP